MAAKKIERRGIALSRNEAAFFPEELEAIANEVEATVKTKEQAELLFRSGLAQENRSELWFDVACRKQVEIWDILRQMITEAEVGEAFHVLNLLDLLILRRSKRKPSSSRIALKSFFLLRLALRRDNLASEAQATLARLSQSHNPAVALTAIPRLLALLKKNMHQGRITTLAVVALGSIDMLPRDAARKVALEASLNLLQQAIRRDDLMPESEDVLVRFTNSSDLELSSRATGLLLEFAEESLKQKRDATALDVLKRVKTLQSVRLLEKALASKAAESEALKILEEFSRGGNTEVAAAAVEALSRHQSTTPTLPKPIPRPRGVERVIADPETLRVVSPVSEASAALLAAIVSQVAMGQCILFLGSAVHVPPPHSSGFDYPESARPLMGTQVSELLAELSVYPEQDGYNLQRVSWYFESKFGFRLQLIETIKSAVQVGKTPSPLLHALARLPFKLIITTNYDNLFEQAIKEAGKKSTVSTYSPRSNRRTLDCGMNPSADNPFILKLHGDLETPDSPVITDEDYIQFTLRMSDKRPFNPVPTNVLTYLMRWPTLFLGYSFRDYNSRLLFKALRWKMDLAEVPPVYAVDSYPDMLIRDLWESRSRYLRFVVSNLWDFVPELYRQVSNQEMPKS